MIQGVTKPFEIGGMSISETEKRRAAGLFLAQIPLIFEYFQIDSSLVHSLPLVAQTDSEGLITMRVEAQGAVSARTPEEAHLYYFDSTEILRRSDSSTASTPHVPAREILNTGKSIGERLHDLHGQLLAEELLGVNNQPVDSQEVADLFAFIRRGSLDF